MKAVLSSFNQMIKFIRRDRMLFAACLAPLLAGAAIRFGVPFIEVTLVRQMGNGPILYPCYGLFDVFFSMITPVMFCFAAAMVMLEERDEHTVNYLFVTRLGRIGYVVSRLCVPAFAALVITTVLLPLFHLTALSAVMILFLATVGALQGMIIALLIVTLSANKLEGMAVTKISTLTILGAMIPYVMPGSIQYIVSFLPSFWAGKAVYEKQLFYMIPAVFWAGAWISFLIKKFKVKML